MRMRQESLDGLPLQPDMVLDMTLTQEEQRAICALLTPAIKAKLQEMAGGEVLEIRVNDPTASEDIASWCRLSGNELLAAIEQSSQLLLVYVRKKLN